VLTWWGDGGGQLQLHPSDGIHKLRVKISNSDSGMPRLANTDEGHFRLSPAL